MQAKKPAKTMFAKRSKKISAMFLAMVSMLFSSCAKIDATPLEKNANVIEETPTEVQPLGLQVKTMAAQGLSLDLDRFLISFPGKVSGVRNDIDLASSHLQFQLSGLSLHGLGFMLDAPVDYNGLERELNVTLHNEELYFSLGAERDDSANYDFRYKTTLNSYDYGGIDETTRGISYYEYGQLDYVISEILSALGKEKISFGLTGVNDQTVIDWDAILDSLETVAEYDANRYVWNLPLGEKTYPVGLVHDDTFVLSGLEFPLNAGNEDVYAALNDDVRIALSATICHEESLDWTLPYAKADYISLTDSLALFKQVANYSGRRSFGVDAALTIRHTEDEFPGDDEHFRTEAVEEECYLNLNADCDFRSGAFDAVHVGLALGQAGVREQNLLLHTEVQEEHVDYYLNLGDVLKVRTNSVVLSALMDAAKEAFTDDSIQNASILEALASVLSTMEAINKTIDAVKATDLYQDIDKGQYQHILSTVVDITAQDNHVEITLDLTPAQLTGQVRVVLNGTNLNAPLGYIELINAGVVSTNLSHTTFLINGTISIGSYEERSIDPSGFDELTHLPSWTEEIRAIAQYDQLQAQIDGYALKKGTTSKVSDTTANAYVYDPVQKRGRKEQGFAFHGSMAFDLKNRLGTGAMQFLDLKENYVNDHNLKLDLTGEAGEDDSDVNDMTGSGNHNAMYFQYDSKNTSATSGSNPYEAENRSEPTKGALKGRFSIHSLNGVLDVVKELTGNDDPRFARLTNLVSSLTAETVLSRAMKGQYFELLSTNLITSADIGATSTRIEIAPGLLDQKYGITLALGYDNDGNPTTIEVWMTLSGDNDLEIYAKITLGETHFSSFPYQFSSHANSSFADYSSLKTLLQFALDTITLGTTSTSKLTTYHISGSVTLNGSIEIFSKKYNITTITIGLDLYVFMQGTDLKIIGRTSVPGYSLVVSLINDDTYTNIFYETTGSDTQGNLFMERLTKIKNYNNRTDTTPGRWNVKVTGKNFVDNLVDWLTKYILNLGSTITDAIADAESTSGEAFHGEDIVEGFAVTNSSLNAPSWQLKIGLGALAHTNLLQTLTATISGKNVSYKDGADNNYNKNTLYSLNGSTNISFGILGLTATINLSMQNVSSGSYVDVWNGANQVSVYKESSVKEKTGWLITRTVTNYYYEMVNGSGNNIWNGSEGMNTSNSKYNEAAWTVKP